MNTVVTCYWPYLGVLGSREGVPHDWCRAWVWILKLAGLKWFWYQGGTWYVQEDSPSPVWLVRLLQLLLIAFTWGVITVENTSKALPDTVPPSG